MQARPYSLDVYKRQAAEIVGGEQYILSAVMHADERNRAMSEALGEDVYHYHLHVVYIPVVEKQILWSKRCKDEALRGTVKEVITQVSRSKKWESKPVLDEDVYKRQVSHSSGVSVILFPNVAFLPIASMSCTVSAIDVYKRQHSFLLPYVPRCGYNTPKATAHNPVHGGCPIPTRS